MVTIPTDSRSRGIQAALAAYVMWGLFPLYWIGVRSIPALEVVAHRVMWSTVLLCGVLLGLRRLPWRNTAVRSPHTLLIFMGSCLLTGANWLIYIWAVGQGRVVEASLGYFITPLVSVLLGTLWLKESLQRPQKWAVFFATLGVLWISWVTHAPPWVALALALTFGGYGLLRKIAPLGALDGLALESCLLMFPAIAWLIWQSLHHSAHFFNYSLDIQLLLMSTGIVTTIPLLLYASAARRLDLVTLGLLQYVSPTLQFLLGVCFFNEVLGMRWIGFVLIWCGLLCLSLKGVLRYCHVPRGKTDVV